MHSLDTSYPTFDRSRPDAYVATQDGKPQSAIMSYNKCFEYIVSHQPSSVYHACKYEGWDIEHAEDKATEGAILTRPLVWLTTTKCPKCDLALRIDVLEPRERHTIGIAIDDAWHDGDHILWEASYYKTRTGDPIDRDIVDQWDELIHEKIDTFLDEHQDDYVREP